MTTNDTGTPTSDETPEGTEHETPEQAPADATPEADAKKPENKYIDPKDIADHLEKENAPRIAQERAEEEAANEIAPYELVPEQFKEIAEEYRQDVSAMAADAGIPAAEAEVMLHLALGGAMEAVSKDSTAALAPGQIPGLDLSNRQACMTYITRKYGDQAPIIVSEAQKAYAKLPKDVQAYLDRDSGTGELLTNSPHVLLALAARNLGWTGLSKESAQTELDKLKAKGKLDAFDLDKRRILSHIVSRGKTTKPAKNDMGYVGKSTAELKRAPVEQRIAAIRRDPNYYRTDNPSLHKALVSEMSELYAKLAASR